MIAPGTGSALSGLFTALGAILAVLIAQWVFRGRISSLEGAVRETEKLVGELTKTIEVRLNQVTERFSELNVVTSAIQEGVSRTQGALEDVEATIEEPHNSIGGETENFDKLRAAWVEIVGHVERIASSSAIDGRTRAKYGRIDRRSYYDLFDALHGDERLPQIVDARRSAELWYSARKRRAATAAEGVEMDNLRQLIAAVPVPA